MTTEARLVTAEDLLRLPDDGYRYELIEGELRRMPPAGHEHGYVAMRVGWRLARYVEEHDLGAVYAAETGFILARNPDTVRAPDVAFVSRERLQAAAAAPGYWPGPPDLAVEVASPSDTFSEVEGKAVEWLAAGARMVIVIDPHREHVAVYRGLTNIGILTKGAILDAGDIVPGWSVRVDDLFA
jgi:Uma2 family endonuclease